MIRRVRYWLTLERVLLALLIVLVSLALYRAWNHQAMFG